MIIAHHNTIVAFFQSFNVGDLISLIGIIVQIILALWIINKVQKNIDNQRHIKNFFIDEVKELKSAYDELFYSINTGDLQTDAIFHWFKLHNTKIQDLLDQLHIKYQIDKSYLNTYKIDLQKIIENDEGFEKSFQNKGNYAPTEKTKKEIIQFRQKNESIFNKLIIIVNDK